MNSGVVVASDGAELSPGQREVLRSLPADVNSVIHSQEEKSAKLLTVMGIGSGLVAFGFRGADDPSGMALLALTIAIVCLVLATLLLLAALQSRGAHAERFQLGQPYALRYASPAEVVAAVRTLSDHAGIPQYYARQGIRRSQIAWYKATLHNWAVTLVALARG